MVRVVLSLILSACTVAVFAAPRIEVEDAWVREAPPGAPVHGAYLTLRNMSDQPAVVIGFESPNFGRVEIHKTVVEDGAARMEEQDRLELPAGARVELAPGGSHLMLFEPTSVPRKGDAVPFVLVLGNGAQLKFEAQVRRGGDPRTHIHDHH